jgi:hypothetical protein
MTRMESAATRVAAPQELSLGRIRTQCKRFLGNLTQRHPDVRPALDCLTAPAETHGTQVGPFLVSGNVCAPPSLTDWLNTSAHQRQIGATGINAPEISFTPDGRYSGRPNLWDYDLHNFAPRVAVAWSRSFQAGWLRKVFGGRWKNIHSWRIRDVSHSFRGRHREFVRCSRLVRSLQPGLKRAWERLPSAPRRARARCTSQASRLQYSRYNCALRAALEVIAISI